MNTKMMLANGKMLDVLNPDPALIDLREVADCLSVIPRFCGRARFPCGTTWNVAEHSLLCWSIYISQYDVADKLVYHDTRLRVLLHDAHEAFTSDIPKPIKVAVEDRNSTHVILSDVEATIDFAVMRAVRREFRLDYFYGTTADRIDQRGAIRHVDNIAFATEFRQLMPTQDWEPPYTPADIKLTPVEPAVAAEAWFKAVAFEATQIRRLQREGDDRSAVC